MPDPSWLLVYGNLYDGLFQDLFNRVESELRRDCRTFHIGVATEAANTYSSLRCYNYLRGCGATIHTHLLGATDNIGGMLFLAGHHRRVFTYSIFGFVDGWSSSNINADEREIRELANSSAESTRLMARVLANSSKLDIAGAEAQIRSQRGIDATSMYEYGIATEVSDDPFPAGDNQPFWIIHSEDS